MFSKKEIGHYIGSSSDNVSGNLNELVHELVPSYKEVLTKVPIPVFIGS